MTGNNHCDRVKREKQGIGNTDVQIASTIKLFPWIRSFEVQHGK